MKPPFTISNDILNLCTDISLLLGKYEGISLPVPKPELRKHTKIRTIQSSLAIEGNTLNIDQVTDIINHKRVVGPKRDILEVKNAIKAYDTLKTYKPEDIKSLLQAHKLFMDGLVKEPGRLRTSNVGVRGGEGIIHMAPKHTQVPELMENLFRFLKEERDLNPLIKSSVFHYELEFIHPFVDGNGRVGRLWQSVILFNYRNLFEYIPIETIIKDRQRQYYEALDKSNKQGESTIFVRFMLETIKRATVEFAKELRPERQLAALRIETAKEKFGKKSFSRKDYIDLHKNISTATASRDLILAVQKDALKKTGEKAITRYQFK